MEWGAFGLRDVILLLVVVAALYLVVMLLRLTQVGRRHAVRKVAEIPDFPPLATYEPEEPELAAPVEMRSAPPAQNFDWDDVRDLFGETGQMASPEPNRQPEPRPPAATYAASASAPSRQAGFGEHLAEHLARSEMEMEVQRMRAEMEHMRTEVEQLRSSRHVSPQYAEAMELAQRGLTAQDMADQLGISLAEAELVHALSRGNRNFEEGEQYGADANASDRFNAFGERISR